MSTSTFPIRNDFGLLAVQKVKAILLWHGIIPTDIGQEMWMPQWVHEILRYVYNVPEIDMLRHFPDLDVGTALLQVKGAPNESEYSEEEKVWICKYETVTIEIASYESSLRLHSYGIHILVPWLYSNKETIMAEWIENLECIPPNCEREEANGSHTPFYKVFKRNLKPLKTFIPYLKNGK